MLEGVFTQQAASDARTKLHALFNQLTLRKMKDCDGMRNTIALFIDAAEAAAPAAAATDAPAPPTQAQNATALEELKAFQTRVQEHSPGIPYK